MRVNVRARIPSSSALANSKFQIPNSKFLQSKVINMQGKMLAVAAAAACLTVLSAAGQNQAPSGQVEFRAHEIEAKFPGGYAVQAVDINKDGKLDVIGVSQRVPEIAWYENPTWERHVMVDGLSGTVNFAAADLDGDGIPEIAFESAFAMSPASSEGL